MSFIKRIFKGRKGKNNDEDFDEDFDEDEEYLDDEDESYWEDDEYVDEIEDDEDDEDVVYVEEYYDEDGNVIPPEDYHLYDFGEDDDIEEVVEYVEEEEDLSENDSPFGGVNDFEDDDSWENGLEDLPVETEWDSDGVENWSEPIKLENVEVDEPIDDVEPNDDVEINYGDSGLLGSRKESKEEIYRRMKYEITDRHVEYITRAVQNHDDVYKMFSYLEENEVPLQYGIALDIFREEDVAGYRAYQQRNLVEGEQVPIDEIHDNSYIEEIMKKRGISIREIIEQNREIIQEEDVTPIPTDEDFEEPEQELVNTTVEDVDHTEYFAQNIPQDEDTTNKDEGTKKGSKLDFNSILSKVSSIGRRGTENDEQVEDVEKDNQLVQDVDKEEQEIIEQSEELVQEDDLVQEVSSDDTEEIILPPTPEKNEKIMRLMKEGEKKRESLSKSTVLVICDGIGLPDYVGRFKMKEVRNIHDLTPVELSLDNVLVISNLIPEGIRGNIRKWLDSRDTNKIRVVTLNGYDYSHDIIETSINLTEDDLEDYFTRYTKENDKSEMGGHLDITSILNGNN